MRDIKFRAWTKNEMLYEGWSGWNESFFVTKEIIFRYDNVMQFTGLLDKNGKDIYEGDIVGFISEHKFRTWNKAGESKSLETAKPDIGSSLGVVVYRNGSFCIGSIYLHDLPVYTKRGDNYSGEWEDKKHSFKIIGNIYETPELISNPSQ